MIIMNSIRELPSMVPHGLIIPKGVNFVYFVVAVGEAPRALVAFPIALILPLVIVTAM